MDPYGVVLENGEREVTGCAPTMLSGRDGTLGAIDSEAEREGTEGVGSKTVAPARSQGFGGDPMFIQK